VCACSEIVPEALSAQSSLTGVGRTRLSRGQDHHPLKKKKKKKMDEATLRRVLGEPLSSTGTASGVPVPDMSVLLGALRDDGTPDFAKMARATGMDPEAFAAHASRLWEKMDALASESPEAYRAFLGEKAREAAAGSNPTGGGGGGGGGGGDAHAFLRTSTGAAPGGPSTAGPRNNGMSKPPRDAAEDWATFLAPAPMRRVAAVTENRAALENVAEGQTTTQMTSWTDIPTTNRVDISVHAFDVGLIAVWRARDDLDALLPVPRDASASGPPLAIRAKKNKPPRVETVALPDPRAARGSGAFPEDGEAFGLSPLEALTSVNRPAPSLSATVYDVEAHPDAVTRALEDPRYQSFLIESATVFVERTQTPPVYFERNPPGGRRCYARRGEASARSAAAAAAADVRRGGVFSDNGLEDVSASLLVEIAGMGVSSTRDSKRNESHREPETPRLAFPLVSEVAPSHVIVVARADDGAPTTVEVTLHLPALVSAASANLQVSSRFVALDPGPGEPQYAAALPVAIDPDLAKAKWTKKTRKLVVSAPVAASGT